MAKKEPTSQTEPTVPFATQFADLGSPQGEPRVESSMEASIRKQIEENDQKKEALQEVKEKLVARDPSTPDPVLLDQAAKSADDTVKAAEDLVKAAQDELRKATRERDKVTMLQMQVPQLTEDQRNRQYLESQKNIRNQAIVEARDRYAALVAAGLLSTDELLLLCPTVTPLDKAISEQNNRKRVAQRGPTVLIRGSR